MKRVMTMVLPVAALFLIGGVAFAQMGSGMTGGMGGMMGGGMMGGDGQPGMPGGDCHGGAASGQAITQEEATQIAQQYAAQHSLTVVKIEPLTAMHMTMWSAELSDSTGAVRTLHIGPSGHVMDHAAPGSQA
jgi:Spy/CpxP family protein refolding chaperone